MRFLQEVLKDVKRLSQQQDDDSVDDQSDDFSDTDLEGMNPDDETDQDQDPNAEPNPDEQTDTDMQQDGGMPSDDDSFAPWDTSAGGGGGSVGAPDQEGGDDPEQQQDAEDPETDETLDAVADEASTDPDRQGVIRNVKGAHLIYKRQNDDGTYEELWIYNISTMQDEMTIRRAILAGTDIPINKQASPDGNQQYTMWAAGNAELLCINGLPN